MSSASPSGDGHVDVIVTIFGGAQTARAVHAGGGLVGMRSSASDPPRGTRIRFVDWPFQLDDPSGERHIDVVREHRPTYAVAPDVDAGAGWPLPDVLDVAGELEQYADVVIVVAKTAPPARIPERYRLGVPFRDGFETPLQGRSYPEFRGHGRVHILGGNPNEQLTLREQYGFDVGSVDTPAPAVWADFGRVFIGAGAGGVEVDDLEVEPWDLRIDRDRADRIEFSVANMVQAWNERRIEVVIASVRGEQTRGMPPVLPPKDLIGGEEIEEIEELLGMSYEAARAQREQFDREMEQTEEVAEFGGRERVQYDLFDPPDDWFTGAGEEPTSGDVEPGPMPDDDAKRERFKRVLSRSDEAVEEIGLGRDALPDRDDEDDEQFE